jgi:hypothetical protein
MGSEGWGRDSAGAPLGRPCACVKRGTARLGGGLFTAPLANILPGKAVLVNHAAMEGDRIARATARIEAAARRIEVAAGRSASGGDPELAAKYHALRTGTGEALAELDRLIGSLER